MTYGIRITKESEFTCAIQPDRFQVFDVPRGEASMSQSGLFQTPTGCFEQ